MQIDVLFCRAEEEITVETPQVPTAFHSVVVTEEQWFGEIEKKKQAQVSAEGCGETRRGEGRGIRRKQAWGTTEGGEERQRKLCSDHQVKRGRSGADNGERPHGGKDGKRRSSVRRRRGALHTALRQRFLLSIP